MRTASLRELRESLSFETRLVRVFRCQCFNQGFSGKVTASTKQQINFWAPSGATSRNHGTKGPTPNPVLASSVLRSHPRGSKVPTGSLKAGFEHQCLWSEVLT